MALPQNVTAHASSKLCFERHFPLIALAVLGIGAIGVVIESRAMAFAGFTLAALVIALGFAYALSLLVAGKTWRSFALATYAAGTTLLLLVPATSMYTTAMYGSLPQPILEHCPLARSLQQLMQGSESD